MVTASLNISLNKSGINKENIYFISVISHCFNELLCSNATCLSVGSMPLPVCIPSAAGTGIVVRTDVEVLAASSIEVSNCN